MHLEIELDNSLLVLHFLPDADPDVLLCRYNLPPSLRPVISEALAKHLLETQSLVDYIEPCEPKMEQLLSFFPEPEVQVDTKFADAFQCILDSHVPGLVESLTKIQLRYDALLPTRIDPSNSVLFHRMLKEEYFALVSAISESLKTQRSVSEHLDYAISSVQSSAADRLSLIQQECRGLRNASSTPIVNIEHKSNIIVEMGFTNEEAEAALELNDQQPEAAVSLLLENPNKVKNHIRMKKATSSLKKNSWAPISFTNVKPRLLDWLKLEDNINPKNFPSESFSIVVGTQSKQSFIISIMLVNDYSNWLRQNSHILRVQIAFQLFTTLKIFYASKIQMDYPDLVFNDTGTLTRHSNLLANVIVRDSLPQCFLLGLDCDFELTIPVQDAEFLVKTVRAGLLARCRLSRNSKAHVRFLCRTQNEWDSIRVCLTRYFRI